MVYRVGNLIGSDLEALNRGGVVGARTLHCTALAVPSPQGIICSPTRSRRRDNLTISEDIAMTSVVLVLALSGVGFGGYATAQAPGKVLPPPSKCPPAPSKCLPAPSKCLPAPSKCAPAPSKCLPAAQSVLAPAQKCLPAAQSVLAPAQKVLPPAQAPIKAMPQH
jgi:hypothetical protein